MDNTVTNSIAFSNENLAPHIDETLTPNEGEVLTLEGRGINVVYTEMDVLDYIDSVIGEITEVHDTDVGAGLVATAACFKGIEALKFMEGLIAVDGASWALMQSFGYVTEEQYVVNTKVMIIPTLGNCYLVRRDAFIIQSWGEGNFVYVDTSKIIKLNIIE